MKEKNERNSSKLILNIFIVLVFLVLVGGVFYLSPNYIREDYDGKTKGIGKSTRLLQSLPAG